MAVAENVSKAAEEAEAFVEAIEKLSEAAERMLAAGLTRRALVLLLHDYTGGGQSGIGKRDIEAVLDALPNLAHYYLEEG